MNPKIYMLGGYFNNALVLQYIFKVGNKYRASFIGRQFLKGEFSIYQAFSIWCLPTFILRIWSNICFGAPSQKLLPLGSHTRVCPSVYLRGTARSKQRGTPNNRSFINGELSFY